MNSSVSPGDAVSAQARERFWADPGMVGSWQLGVMGVHSPKRRYDVMDSWESWGDRWCQNDQDDVNRHSRTIPDYFVSNVWLEKRVDTHFKPWFMLSSSSEWMNIEEHMCEDITRCQRFQTMILPQGWDIFACLILDTQHRNEQAMTYSPFHQQGWSNPTRISVSSASSGDLCRVVARITLGAQKKDH